MKPSVTLPLCTLAAGLVGIGIGWALRAQKSTLETEKNARGVASQSAHQARNQAGKNEPSEATAAMLTEKRPKTEDLKASIMALLGSEMILEPESLEFWDLNQKIARLSQPESLELLQWFKKLGEDSQDNPDKLEKYEETAESVLMLLIGNASSGDPWEVERYRSELVSDVWESSNELLFARKAAADIDRLKQEIAAMPKDADSKEAALMAAIHAISKTDPQAALAYALQAPTDIDLQGVKLLGLDKIMAANPEQTVQKFIMAGQPSLAAELMSTWADTAPTDLQQWLTQQPPEVKLSGLSVLANQSNADPKAILGQLQGLTIPVGDDAVNLAQNLGERLAEQANGQEAWGDIQGMQAALRPTAERAFLNHVLSEDPVKGSEILATLQEGPTRDRGIKAMITNSNLIQEDPAAAFEWAMHHSNAKERAQLTKMVADKWQQADPTAAAQAIALLSAEEREALGKP